MAEEARAPVNPSGARDAPGPASVFGPLARRLEPRALAPYRSDSSLVRVAYRAEAASPAEADLFESLSLVPPEPEAGGYARLSLDREALLQRAPLDPLATLWLTTHANACAAPSPLRLMGILNATPDSFSDGGQHLDPTRATERGLELVRAGASLLDVGGESTRPGSRAVPPDVEAERVLPVIEALRPETRALLSVDTRRAAVAAAALDRGADWVNDTSAGVDDPEMLPLIAERGCSYVAMHRRGTPAEMQRAPHYAEAVREVLAELRIRVAACLNAGIEAPRIVLDPGIGFGKRLEDNLDLLRRLPELRSLGLPLLLGVSRKSFLGRLTGREDPREREAASAAASVACVLGGAEILRVHDVAGVLDAVEVAGALAARPDEA